MRWLKCVFVNGARGKYGRYIGSVVMRRKGEDIIIILIAAVIDGIGVGMIVEVGVGAGAGAGAGVGAGAGAGAGVGAGAGAKVGGMMNGGGTDRGEIM